MITTTPHRILALMQRERLTRYAGGKLGPAWAILTPVAWIAFVVVLFRALGRTPPILVRPEIFVATGVLPYVAFRQAITSITRAYPAHRYMRYIRPVSINDIFLATMALEALNFAISALVIFGTTTLVFDAPLPNNAPAVALGFVIAWCLASGLGRCVAVLGILSDSIARLVPILLRPLFWISGIFYTATELPILVQNLLWYSPLLHVTEVIREGYFASYTSPVANIWVPLAFASVFYLMSIPFEHLVLRRQHLRFKL